MISDSGEVLRVIRTKFESLQVGELLIPWLDVLVARIMSLDEILDCIPASTHPVLTITRSETMRIIERYVTRCVIREAHRVLTNAIQAMQNVGPFHTLRFIVAVLLE
jgi:hypothetical protein